MAAINESTFTVVHVSDLHLDLGRFGRINPDTGVSTAWESAERCWRYVCDWTIEHQPDVFLFTGDAFANGRPVPEAQERFAAGLRSVTAAGVPCVLVRGNHELIGVQQRHRDVLTRFEDIPGVTVVTSPRIVTLDSGLQIGCVPWPRRHEILVDADLTGLDPEQIDALVSTALTDIIDGFADRIDPGLGPSILAGHFTVSTATLGTNNRGSETTLAALFNEPVVPVDLVSEDPWAYVALGHIHQMQQVSDRAWYAGSPDRIDFSEEHDPKGFLVARITHTPNDANVPASVDIVATPARKMHTIRVTQPDQTFDATGTEPGTLIKVVLPDGERIVPPEIAAAVKEAGATIVKVDTRPARHQRKDTGELVDVDTPILDALRTWMDRSDIPTEDRPVLTDAARTLIEQAPLP